MKSYVLITGATGGLGKAFVAECASRGWDLFLTDLREPALDAVAQGAERLYNVRVVTSACDLTDAASRERLWQTIGSAGLRFHMLVNVAGVDFEGAFDERQIEELRTILRLNVEATVEMIRHALPYRDVARPMRVINVSSLASFYPMPLKAVYAASKRFLLDLSIALNRELRDSGVTVTALCPAGMPTTPGCVEKIEAQGFMGRITTMNVGRVAAQTVTGALAGRSVIIPGGINHLLRSLGGLFPPAFVASFINRRWHKSRQRLAQQVSSGEAVSLNLAPVHELGT